MKTLTEKDLKEAFMAGFAAHSEVELKDTDDSYYAKFDKLAESSWKNYKSMRNESYGKL